MEIRTQEQNIKMHVQISQLKRNGYKATKEEIVYDYFGDNRSTTKLTIEQCQDFILWLNEKNEIVRVANDKMRKKIIALMKHELGWSMNDIEQFCKHKGKFKKSFNLHGYKELPQLVSQFQAIHKSEFKKLKT